MEDLYYMQDKRGYVGNDIVWLGLKGHGYVCDILKAQTYTREEAIKMNKSRDTDVPWPKEYIDARMKHVIDMQDCKIDEALKGKKIRLKKEPRRRPTTGKSRGNCYCCGKIVWDYDVYNPVYCSHSCEVAADVSEY